MVRAAGSIDRSLSAPDGVTRRDASHRCRPILIAHPAGRIPHEVRLRNSRAYSKIAGALERLPSGIVHQDFARFRLNGCRRVWSFEVGLACEQEGIAAEYSTRRGADLRGDHRHEQDQFLV